ncbi:hypothetical protein MTR_0015s0170 [Medicago truncatula]|uniref:Uncharacterized protein n=1 Tax=Medicago truncatula TaxID=3880 RepID=A0A072TIS7_MEDTR|nr:hypothetical protein MTR_0015s0170 [Medicago truncatula]
MKFQNWLKEIDEDLKKVKVLRTWVQSPPCLRERNPTDFIPQPQFQPYQQQYQQQPRQQAPRTKFDPIPIKYAELFPDMLTRNLLQTILPPPMPKKLRARFRPDLSYVFHQGALGHDIERCYAFKNAVQDLFEADLLPF